MCGAAQQPGGTQGAPSYAPGGQPVVSQAAMSVRAPQQMAGTSSTAGSQYPYSPAGQASGWQTQQAAPGQASGWQAQPSMPGQAGWQGSQQPGYPQQGYQQPSAEQQRQAYLGMQPAAPAVSRKAGLDPMALLLGLAGGVVGGIIGAIIWAFILQLTKTNISFIAVGLGFLVGLGVLLGARGQRHLVLAVLAGVLGLLSFFLALYFRLSLALADVLGQGTSLFALPFGDFSDILKLYLQDNPINYLYFVLVPLIAAGTAFGGLNRSRAVRRR
jgi:hypothetical protein